MRHHSTAPVFRDQCGSVLIGGLILVLAVTLIGAGLYQASVIETRVIVSTEDEVKARYAAESGLNRAVADVAWPEIQTSAFGANSTFDGIKPLLNADNTTPSAFYATTCFGTTSTTCTSVTNPQKAAYLVQAVNHPDADKFWLIATACVPGPAEVPCPGTRRAAAQVKALIKKPTAGSGFPGSYFGGSTSCTSGNPCINIHTGDTFSYDSRKPGCTPVPPATACEYNASTNSSNNGDIISNGNITVSGQVHGDVIGYQDVGGDPSDIDVTGGHVYGQLRTGGTVGAGDTGDGGVFNNSGHAPTPLPAEPNCGPPYTTLTEKTALNPTGNVTLSAGLTVAGIYNASTGVLEFNSGTATLEPGNYCFQTVHVSTNGATLAVTGTAVTGIFVDKLIYLQSGAQLNNISRDPQMLQFISTFGNTEGNEESSPSGQCGGAMVCLDAGGTTMYMTLYAPKTKVKFQGGGQIYGAIAADTIDVTGGSSVYYDEYLGSGLATILRGVPLDGGAANTPANYAVLKWQQPTCMKGSNSWSCS